MFTQNIYEPKFILRTKGEKGYQVNVESKKKLNLTLTIFDKVNDWWKICFACKNQSDADFRFQAPDSKSGASLCLYVEMMAATVRNHNFKPKYTNLFVIRE